jgi:hypothetical protein
MSTRALAFVWQIATLQTNLSKAEDEVAKLDSELMRISTQRQ